MNKNIREALSGIEREREREKVGNFLTRIKRRLLKVF